MTALWTSGNTFGHGWGNGDGSGYGTGGGYGNDDGLGDGSGNGFPEQTCDGCTALGRLRAHEATLPVADLLALAVTR